VWTGSLDFGSCSSEKYLTFITLTFDRGVTFLLEPDMAPGKDSSSLLATMVTAVLRKCESFVCLNVTITSPVPDILIEVII
jgi:hypothetical protein